MMYKRPLRFTTLHLAQRFRIDDETFIQLTPNDNQMSEQPKFQLYLPYHQPSSTN